MKKGFMYLTAIIDGFSRFIVSWCLSNTLSASSVHQVVDQAIDVYGKPEIVNSD